MGNQVEPERREVHFRGRVQGVGFRWTASRIASHFAVVGYVKNLPDGRVQMVCEGESGELDRFLAAIDAEMGRYIADTAVTKTAAIDQFTRFDIRY